MGTATAFSISATPTLSLFSAHGRSKRSTSLSSAHGRSKRSTSLSSFFSTTPKFKTKRSFYPLHQLNAPSSILGATSESLDASSPKLVGAKDLLIIGPGVLGRLVAEKWREENQGSQVFGQTMTKDHHDELVKMGINPLLRGTKTSHKFPYVVFCAPPSRTPDYPGDIREGILSWSEEGPFIFTSSTAPYDCNDNGPCDEDNPIVPLGRSPRTDVLLKAEKVVLESGGCVVRLAGLYKADRGAHVYWLRKGTVDARPDHILNLLHYEDAASLVVAALKKKSQDRVFLGCDNNPLSRQDLMNIVNKSGKYSEKFEGFTGTSDSLGKKLNNSKTRKELSWEPKYPSFGQFLGVSV